LIVQEGSPAEIYNRPANEFVSRFIGEANLLDGEIKAISEEQTEVDVNGLALIAPLEKGLSTGQKVIVSVRPERITLYDRAEDAPKNWRNVFEGTVESAIFLGPTARYYIRLTNDNIVIADKATMDERLHYLVNDQVCVGWESTNNVVLPA
jgi:ABC-type Fe3+/spermidine/putrescine transport system ATPase subunit